MTRLSFFVRASGALAGLLMPALGASAAPQPMAERIVPLKGGGCLQVVTRYHDADYEPPRLVSVDPILRTCFPVGARSPLVVEGFVEPRRGGFAPCLAGSDNAKDRADCVAGSSPVLLDTGSPASFGFSFTRLFNPSAKPAPAAAGGGGASFGYAAFIVTLEVIAENGARETVTFPVSVTVRERDEDGRPASPADDALANPFSSSSGGGGSAGGSSSSAALF